MIDNALTRQIMQPTALAYAARSHLMFTFNLKQIQHTRDVVTTVCSKILFVDPVGSERLYKTGADTHAAEHGTQCLCDIITKLGSKKCGHIPYRATPFTSCLADALGGNCKTFMIGTLSPSLMSQHDTLNTLQLMKHARNVNNHVKPDIVREGL
eukprot:NODE_546_length_751_cov_403.762821_g537_i0.p1 GENE.NODE_546_length_751_cov_403.762821_g537_i0~~NODE_546_length_751_cov_403.762821_g537_i0.p1  ORF type:complete len:154 (+),score=23.27 NODE_546_length_751_cov_403.762821_g537_i0:220-681(+)